MLLSSDRSIVISGLVKATSATRVRRGLRKDYGRITVTLAYFPGRITRDYGDYGDTCIFPKWTRALQGKDASVIVIPFDLQSLSGSFRNR
jgi:hypothetical protein